MWINSRGSEGSCGLSELGDDSTGEEAWSLSAPATKRPWLKYPNEVAVGKSALALEATLSMLVADGEACASLLRDDRPDGVA
jgi:hypothetical protein